MEVIGEKRLAKVLDNLRKAVMNNELQEAHFDIVAHIGHVEGSQQLFDVTAVAVKNNGEKATI